MSKSLEWGHSPLAPSLTARHRVARWLRCASRVLRLAARRWHDAGSPKAGEPVLLEFHAEAGAPEGALFVNGVRIGTLPGVTRL